MGKYEMGRISSLKADTVPRRKEGTHPDCNSDMKNTEPPIETAANNGSKPTVRDSPLPSENRRVREANAGRPKGQGKP